MLTDLSPVAGQVPEVPTGTVNLLALTRLQRFC
jgi:hypothetical protein